MQIFAPVVPYLRRHTGRIVAGVLAIAGGTACALVQPYILRLAVDRLGHRHMSISSLTTYTLLFLLAAVGQAIFTFIQRSTVNRVSRFLEYDLRNDAFRHLQTLDQGFYSEMHTGDLMARLTNDLNSVQQFVRMGLISAFSIGLMLIGVAVLMFFISWRLALVAFAVLPFASLTMIFVSRAAQKRFRLVQDQFGQLSTNAQENFSGIRVVKAFTQEEREMEAFARSNEEYVRRSLHYVRLSGIMWPLMYFVMGLALALVLYIGGTEVANRQITLGQFVQFNGYLAMLTWPVIGVGWLVNLYQQGQASMTRIMEVMNRQPAIANDGRTLPLKEVEGEIEFRNVGIRLGDRWILRHVSFKVPRGFTVAIVGTTGVGKTTLMNLVPRVLEADEGEVLIDGKDVRCFTLEVIRQAVGYVPQDTFLFSATLRSNTMFGVNEADDGELTGVVSVSRLGKDLEQFPFGLETIVGERGVSLSGGQKQRTALARALLRNPTILILDDAMSSVDTHTQAEILAGLKEFMKTRTTLITAMRISTVKDADQIVVIDEGGVVEQGTHQELVLNDRLYARMYRRELLQQELEVE